MSGKLLVNLSVLIPQPTGISVYANGILPSLKSLDPTLLIANPKPEFSCYLVPDHLTPAHGTTGHFRRLLWTQFQLPAIYQNLQGNLLFSPLPEAPLYSPCCSIVMAHDLIPLRFPRKGSRLTAYFKYYIPQVLHQAQHIVCNSLATAEDLTRFFKVPEAKITPIPLAYNREQFQFLDLPTRNYFLYIGRHDAYKNLNRLITAFSQLNNSCRNSLKNDSDYQLWLAGPTDQIYTPQLQAQVKALNLESQVQFLNYVSATELPRILNQAVALVFPSLWEGFGLPVLEAMACGTPVIASNLSSLTEVGGEAMVSINPYQVEEIAEAMKFLAGNEPERSRLRQLGLHRARQFSWEKTGQQTAAVLEKYL
ncbi:MAG: glycosyltransferase family 4 protein [Oscillatoriales cyanobacterium RM2_1_1]|nr:glycosyltransferase family 4 protein [Oscillatoriales cyanobacterium SM2_3_0]NJO44912.1 glycosyltransferase family 4 protein [Oscillatoriales cyanobacterium RM2_1_1]